MNRYIPVACFDDEIEEPYVKMKLWPDGQYVLFKDLEPLLKELLSLRVLTRKHDDPKIGEH